MRTSQESVVAGRAGNAAAGNVAENASFISFVTCCISRSLRSGLLGV